MSGNYKNKTYPLRIEEEILDSIKAIAALEGRTANKQIEKILDEWIIEYTENKNEKQIQRIKAYEEKLNEIKQKKNN